MIPVARWRARGMHAGIVVPLRKIVGNHCWRVVARYSRPAGDGRIENVEQTFDASAPCPIRAMHQTVLTEIGRDLPDGALVHDACLEFFIPGRC